MKFPFAIGIVLSALCLGAVASSMTANEKQKLSVDFQKALVKERKALSKQERSDLKSLANDQSARRKAWRLSEKRARRKYFNEHLSGPDRRQYVQDYLKRKTAFEKSLKDEAEAARKSWKEKEDYLKLFQKERQDQFRASLEQGRSPSPDLWPKFD